MSEGEELLPGPPGRSSHPPRGPSAPWQSGGSSLAEMLRNAESMIEDMKETRTTNRSVAATVSERKAEEGRSTVRGTSRVQGQPAVALDDEDPLAAMRCDFRNFAQSE